MDRHRIAWIAILFCAVSLALIVRLWELQVQDGDFWTREALKARTRKESRPARRGAIFDRLGRPLAEGILTYDLVFTYGDFRRSTALGSIQMLEFLAYGVRPTLTSILSNPQRSIDRLGSLAVEDVLNCRPSQRRKDFLFYLMFFTDFKRTQALKAVLEEAAPGTRVHDVIKDFPRLSIEGVELDRGRLNRVGVALSEETLIASLDDTIQKIDEDIAKASLNRPESQHPFEWERNIHSDYDHRHDRWRRKNIPHDMVVELELRHEDFPGFQVDEVDRRVYPEETIDILPGLIGFVRQPTPDSLKRADEHFFEWTQLVNKEDKTKEEVNRMFALEIFVDELNYRLNDEQGYRGLEGALEGLLRGKKGWRKVEKDAKSQRVFEELDVKSPIPGSDIVLTLDLDVQRAVEEVIDRTGELIEEEFSGVGLVLMSLPGGEILAMGSTSRVSRNDYLSALANGDRSVFHLAYGPYSPPPPGSVFKPIVALAGIEAGILNDSFTVFCDGGVGTGTSRFKCLGHHGEADLTLAMSKSCNAYFAELAVALGYDAVAASAKRFGYGSRSRFSVSGLLPIFKNDLERPWGGELVLPREVEGTLRPEERGVRPMRAFGCGQFYIDDCTAIQVARSFGAIATGYLPSPHIVKGISAGLGSGFQNAPPPTPLGVSQGTLNRVRETLHAVMAPGGTAAPENGRDLSRYKLIGKTGTPEFSKKGSGDNGEWANHSHAWFGGYLPHDRPRLTVAVIVYSTSLHGGDIARPILDELFKDPRVSPYIENDLR